MDPTRPSPIRDTAPAGVPRRRLRVLVADDEPGVRMVVGKFLTRRGHEVVEAPDAETAARLVDGTHFDAALVDYHMPGDGRALARRLARLPHLAGRTILMSGDVGGAEGPDPHDTGAWLLSKPFDYHEMVRLLEDLAR